MAYGCDPELPEGRNGTFILTGEIDGGLPPFELPDFTYDYNETLPSGNSTEIHLDFSGMVKELGSAILIIPLITILESVAIAKSFCEYSIIENGGKK